MSRTVLITGGSAGIGAGICRHFLDAGDRVVALSRRKMPYEHPNLVSVEIDLADTEATRQSAVEIAARYPADVIIHNAGAVREKLLPEVDVADITFLSNLHIAAAVALVQANLDSLKASGQGRIVLISSRAALGLAKRTAYSATKAGMIGLARTWALELGEYGITSNVVAPGPIAETEMFDEVIPPGSDKIPKIAQAIPVKRLGNPGDVARAVAFLAAPDNGFVTGQTLFVCGGTSVGSISY